MSRFFVFLLSVPPPANGVLNHADEEWVLPDADNNRNDLTLLRQTVYILAKGAVPYVCHDLLNERGINPYRDTVLLFLGVFCLFAEE